MTFYDNRTDKQTLLLVVAEFNDKKEIGLKKYYTNTFMKLMVSWQRPLRPPFRNNRRTRSNTAAPKSARSDRNSDKSVSWKPPSKLVAYHKPNDDLIRGMLYLSTDDPLLEEVSITLRSHPNEETACS